MIHSSSSCFRLEDGNESICGACRRSGMLICCEHCPAAFHPECAGYSDIGSVPTGDWFCFLCSRKLGLPFELGGTFNGEIGQNAMIMCDTHGEVFQKGLIIEKTENYVTIKGPDKSERITLDDRRLWRGTLDPASWTMTPENEYRPNSRAFEIDYQQLAADAMQETKNDVARNSRNYKEFLQQKKAEPNEQNFISLLEHFWRIHLETDGIPWPSFGYLISLIDLWEAVQKYGGFRDVCHHDQWELVCRDILPNDDWRKFALIAKQTYRSVLLDAESYGGIDALKILYSYTPAQNKQSKTQSSDQTPEESLPRKRRNRSTGKKRRSIPSADAWISPLLNCPTHGDVLTATTPDATKTWPQTFSASRAIQEYRSAIGIVDLTETAKNLGVGDKVDVRVYKDSSIGPWRAAKILTISTASAMEGFRRIRVKLRKSKDTTRFTTLTEEWVTLLARPTAWGTTLTKPAVLIRPIVKPYFPPVPSSIVIAHSISDRVEAWLGYGWWPATILDIRESHALVQGDVIPLGEGLKWISALNYIRSVPQDENDGYGMIESLKMDEQLYPKEMEKRLNVTVDKTTDGHMILSFKRLDQKPSR